MYVYNYRIYDRYKRTVVSLAVLGDERRSWKPNQFGYELWGCEVNFKFPIVKLRLLQTTVVSVRSQSQPQCLGGHGAFEGARNTQEMQRSRFASKLAMTRRLYSLGYEREVIINLFGFIDARDELT